MPTEPWATWRDSHFGDPYMVWHDGPNFEALLDAARADRDEVFEMIRRGLRENDALAAQSVAELASAGMALPDARSILEDQVASASGDFRICLGQALHSVTKDECWSELVMSVLTNPDEHWGIRLHAAMALADFRPTGAIIDAFRAGVLDPEYLVRHHSADGLLKAAGRSPDISHHPRLFELIATPQDGPPTDADRRAWNGAAAMLAVMARANLG